MTDQDTFTVNLAGREIRFRYPIPGQLIILRRRLLRLQQQAMVLQDDDEQMKLGAQVIIDTLDVVESLILDREDAEFLEQAMMQGKVSHEEVTNVLSVQAAPPKPVAKKTVAKKATPSRARTKR